jgi:hypothetical protein
MSKIFDCQQRIADLLNADTFFNDPDESKKLLAITQRKGNIQSEVQQKLLKIGAGVIVMLPLVTFEGAESRITLGMKFGIIVTENPIVNQGASGTQKAAETIVEKVCQLIHWKPNSAVRAATKRFQLVSARSQRRAHDGIAAWHAALELHRRGQYDTDSMNHKTKSRIKIVLLAIGFAVLFLLPILARGQAPRPPIQKLSALTGDVNIATPLDLQPLRYDNATSKWINDIHLGDIVIYSSTLTANTADFQNATLSNATGTVLDWSDAAGARFAQPIIDNNGFGRQKTIDPSGRKLYKPDGSTVLFDWSGTNPKFPTLTNSASNVFLTTDASGNMSTATVPNAGTIPATVNLLAGDGAGNAINAGTYGGNTALIEIDPTGLFIGPVGDFASYISIQNPDSIHSSDVGHGFHDGREHSQA